MKKKQGIILLGAGGHSQACIDVIESQGLYQIACIVGKPGEVRTTLLGYNVIYSDDDMTYLNQVNSKEKVFVLVAIGQIQTPEIRIRLYNRVKAAGLSCPAIVSPAAYVSPRASLGEGTIVMHGAIVNAGARIGENCIINSCALIEHGATIQDNCHISTGAVVNGDALIGMGSFLGSGSVVREGLQVGSRCLIGMGVALRHDLLESTCFHG